MNLYMKVLIALVVAGVGIGGYYAYGQYQQKQETSKSEDLRSKILNAPAAPKGVF